LIKTKKKGRKK